MFYFVVLFIRFTVQSAPKQWNAAFNNAPVEKGPPVNVVITSSDPLPAQNTSTNQLSFSVTIPPQHIKNNSNNTSVSTVGHRFRPMISVN